MRTATPGNLPELLPEAVRYQGRTISWRYANLAQRLRQRDAKLPIDTTRRRLLGDGPSVVADPLQPPTGDDQEAARFAPSAARPFFET